MKAIVYTQYGTPDVLQVKEVGKPVPEDDEVLVKVHAVAINAADAYLLKGTPFLVRLMTGGLRKPKNTILGADIAGRVEAVGKNVKQFQPGDDVLGDTSPHGFGGMAEYVCASENAFVLKPDNVSFETAAAVPMAAVTALQGLRDKGKIQSGQKVLINGASGGVGTFAVQIAKSFGAEVTAVCSTGKIDMVRSIGADHAIDYITEDFTRKGKRYDLILAANGDYSIFDYRRALTPGGTLVVAGGSMKQIFQSMLVGPMVSRFGNKQTGNVMANPNQKDLGFIVELLETGQIIPVIDRCYPLSEAADALRYLGEGHARGKVIITVEQGN